MNNIFKSVEENKKSYQKIMKQIQDLILEGHLKKGDKLPPERQLAETLGVGRPTLKQSLSALEALGIIESKHGGGNYVSSDMSNVFNPFTLKYYLTEGKQNDITEFRYILEVQLAKLAALKATEDDIKKLDEIVSKMESVKSSDERLILNFKFHLELASINENTLIKSVYESIIDLVLLQTSITDGVHFYESHKEIVDAIKSGDSKLAGELMSKHFEVKFPNYEYYDKL
jgi:GntR family transcriptional repressor for pyruvate dehydrogenase complex